MERAGRRGLAFWLAKAGISGSALGHEDMLIMEADPRSAPRGFRDRGAEPVLRSCFCPAFARAGGGDGYSDVTTEVIAIPAPSRTGFASRSVSSETQPPGLT